MIDRLPGRIGGVRYSECSQYWDAADLDRQVERWYFEDPAQLVARGRAVLEQLAYLAEAAPTEKFLITSIIERVRRRIERAESMQANP